MVLHHPQLSQRLHPKETACLNSANEDDVPATSRPAPARTTGDQTEGVRIAEAHATALSARIARLAPAATPGPAAILGHVATVMARAATATLLAGIRMCLVAMVRRVRIARVDQTGRVVLSALPDRIATDVLSEVDAPIARAHPAAPGAGTRAAHRGRSSSTLIR